MSKKKDTFINMVLSLFVITIISGFSLGYVNELTIGPIEKGKIERKVNALKLVLPTFDNNPIEDVQLIKSSLVQDSVEVFPAYENSKFVGAAIIGSTEKGFSGLIKLIVGFSPEGTIKNIVVLEQKETPGLGTKMKDEKFLAQFREKNPSAFNLKVTKDGGEVDALTGATITSRAFGEAVQMAYDEFMKNNGLLIELKN
ncbi:MAG: RnfABCDGE type electron transport complex subunit G [Lutibacter sp.]|uniref:RnfABCDGE type electron transport complex subunit G n=1 Tax=Lutibacter sp. TaxID=1925666 RepID=UPI0017AE18F1|nr:RnfABCDGE type electron transport complex subunit G [Lutibacter sp.]MBT8318417.1 RnfABCDGE type electron transport complex subunit G [Lutibacter sp.]NNJ59275.1 RnfABCDGE type electron transport complex subunit G [Lutibacter sp.]